MCPFLHLREQFPLFTGTLPMCSLVSSVAGTAWVSPLDGQVLGQVNQHI